jgi:hypothetical protein
VIKSHRESLSYRVIEIWITKENKINKCNEVWLWDDNEKKPNIYIYIKGCECGY